MHTMLFISLSYSQNIASTNGGQPKPDWLPARPAGINLIVKNSCSQDIWPGLSGVDSKTGKEYFGLADSKNPAGFHLKAGDHKIVPLQTGLGGGRVWTRTGCSFKSSKFVCDIGDCGSSTNNYDGSCFRSGGIGANSLAEFTVDNSGTVWYDLSIVDGYTMPVKMILIGDTVDVPGAPPGFSCGNPTCSPLQDFSQCPPELIKVKNGKAIGCDSISNAINDNDLKSGPTYGSILTKYYSDPALKSHIECSCGIGSCAGTTEAEVMSNLVTSGRIPGVDRTGFCCSPNNKLYNGRAKDYICTDKDKPMPLNGFGNGKSYSEVFKAICPLAYSWQFDDESSTFQCKGQQVSYIVEFC